MPKAHSFDPDLAQEYGLEEAVMIHSFQWWIGGNRANGKNSVEGRTWSFNSYQALAELFPYWTPRKVRRVVESLVTQGILLKGQRKLPEGDPRNWYAFSDEPRFLGTDTPSAEIGRGVPKSAEDAPKSADVYEEQLGTQLGKGEGGYTEGGASTLIDRQAEYRTDPPAARRPSRMETSEPLLGNARQRADQWVNSNAKLLDRELGFSNFLPLRAFLEELFGRYPDLSLPPDLLDFALKDAKEHSEGSSWGVSCRAFETGLRKALARAQANGGLPRIGRSEARGAH